MPLSSTPLQDLTVREQTIELLRTLGMTHVFGNPGSTELPLFRDFPADFRYVLGLQEAVVVGMADGYAQATGTAAFVNLHSAAGVGNAMGAIFTAACNRTPLVITAGQQARRLLPYDPFLASPRAAELPLPHVKWSCEPARAADVGAALQRAWTIAMQPPCGPTLVSIPIDDWDALAAPLPPRLVVPARATPDAAELAALAEELDRAARPLFVVGSEVDDAGSWPLLTALAERHGASVCLPALHARVAFPQNHSLYAGVLPSRPEALRARLDGHDLVLALGCRAFTFHVDGDPLSALPDGVRLFQITDDLDFASSAIGGRTLIGDCGHAVRELLDRSRRSAPIPSPPARAVPGSSDPDAALTPARLIAALETARDRDAIIVEEAPTTRDDIDAIMRIEQPASFFACASGGLGFGMAGATGITLGAPGRQVIAVIGDGSAMYAIPALFTAARQGVPLKVVIVNNRGYAALERFSTLFGMEPVGTRLQGLDFVRLAEGQGVPAERVDAVATVDAALRRLLDAEGPRLLEVMVATAEHGTA